MKKLLLLFVITLFSLSSKAQRLPSKGNVILNTEFFYNVQNNNYDRDQKQYLLKPNIRAYLDKYFSIGFGLGFEGFESEVQSVVNNDQTFDEEINVRTYDLYANLHSRITDRIYYDTQLEFSFGSGDGEFEAYNSDISVRELTLSPGIYFFTNSSLLFTVRFGEISVRNTSEEIEANEGFFIIDQDEFNDETFNIGFGLNTFRFGVSFFLNHKEPKKKAEE